MAEKCDKRRHNASRALGKTSSEERRAILKLYSRIGNRKRVYDVEVPEEFRETYGERIEIGGIIEELNTSSAEILVDALKKIQRVADIGSSEVAMTLPLVLPLLKFENEEQVRYEAVKAVGKIGDRGAAEVVRIIADNDLSEKVKECAIKALGLMKAEEYFHFLSSIVNDYWDKSIRVRRAAAFALGRLNPERSVNVLIDCLVNDPDKLVRQEAAESILMCLLKMEKNSATDIIRVISSQFDAENEPEVEVRLAVINAATVIEDEKCIGSLITALRSDPSSRVRGQAANALAHYFSPEIEKALLTSFNNEKGSIKKRVALAIAQYAMKNPLGLHDEICRILIEIQKLFPRGSYIWKEAVKALPAV